MDRSALSMLSKRSISTALWSLLCLVMAWAQPCGNESFLKEKYDFQYIENQLYNYRLHHKTTYREAITVPVVVHIVWNTPEENISDELVLSQIAALNRDYNAQNEDLTGLPEVFKPLAGNMGLHFCLAGTDPEGKPSNGIIRVKTDIPEIGLRTDVFHDTQSGSDAWDTEHYLNIWVANTGKSLAGFGSYPGETNIEERGVVVSPKYFGINNHPKYGLGRTVVHEVGHYFGLLHPWADDADCSTDDMVNDTPMQLGAYSGCPVYPQSGCSDNELFMTFMDYVNDPCMVLFTQGQVERAHEVIAVFRPGLLDFQGTCLTSSEAPLSAQIYPNPVQDLLHCQFNPAPMRELNYQIYNAQGALLISNKMLINDALDIDINYFSTGIYFLKIDNYTTSFIKL